MAPLAWNAKRTAAHSYVPVDEPIDLLNVAFGNSPAHCAVVPDRVTARAGLRELMALPNGGNRRPWQLIEVDVCKERRQGRGVVLRVLSFHPPPPVFYIILFRARSAQVPPSALDSTAAEQHIVRWLLQPAETVMDLSLATALCVRSVRNAQCPLTAGRALAYRYHAAHAGGRSNARVVLVGNGADEQLAGASVAVLVVSAVDRHGGVSSPRVTPCLTRVRTGRLLSPSNRVSRWRLGGAAA
jgi:hypothetical protein